MFINSTGYNETFITSLMLSLDYQGLLLWEMSDTGLRLWKNVCNNWLYFAFALAASNSVGEVVPVSARSITPAAPLVRAQLPPLRRISIEPPIPAPDYHSSSAESLQELASSENAAHLKKLHDVADLAASYPPTQPSPVRIVNEQVDQTTPSPDGGHSTGGKKKKAQTQAENVKIKEKENIIGREISRCWKGILTAGSFSNWWGYDRLYAWQKPDCRGRQRRRRASSRVVGTHRAPPWP